VVRNGRAKYCYVTARPGLRQTDDDEVLSNARGVYHYYRFGVPVGRRSSGQKWKTRRTRATVYERRRQFKDTRDAESSERARARHSPPDKKIRNYRVNRNGPPENPTRVYLRRLWLLGRIYVPDGLWATAISRRRRRRTYVDRPEVREETARVPVPVMPAGRTTLRRHLLPGKTRRATAPAPSDAMPQSDLGARLASVAADPRAVVLFCPNELVAQFRTLVYDTIVYDSSYTDRLFSNGKRLTRTATYAIYPYVNHDRLPTAFKNGQFGIDVRS